MPNSIAYFALFAWPLVTLLLFARYPPGQAAVISTVASFLILPSSMEVDLPALPPLDKVSVPAIALLLGLAVYARGTMRFRPRSKVAIVLLVLLIAGPFVTAVLNDDPLRYGPKILPGLTPYDALSSSVNVFIAMIPFFVGRCLLADWESHRFLLVAFLVAGLAYALPMLAEVRLSPFLHRTVYGYFPHDFAQQKRFGGFRPVVFMQHGLWVAFFAMSVTVAAATLWRAAPPERRSGYLAATFGLLVVLVLCKSVGSIASALFLLPIIWFVGLRSQLKIAAVLVAIATLYPALRGADLVPVDAFLSAAGSVSEAREQSLEFRFVNEDVLLEKARERPAFGWGTWGRNRVFDPRHGTDISTTDGSWIIAFGTHGWVGFLGLFGLLAWPVIAVWWWTRGSPPVETAGLCLLLATTMVNLIPNSTMPPWTWLVAGALLGYAERARRPERPAKQPPTSPQVRTVI